MLHECVQLDNHCADIPIDTQFPRLLDTLKQHFVHKVTPRVSTP